MPRTRADAAEPTAADAPQPLSGALARLRVRHLQLLDALQRTGSLRRAATHLGITQPAAMSLVDDLEHAFGAALVVRDHSGSTLTAAGCAVVDRARLAIEEVALARDAATRSTEAASPLRIGASPYLISALLPETIALLHRELPGLRVDVREGTLDTLLAALLAGELDAVLGSVDRATVFSADSGLEAVSLGIEPMRVVAPRGHPLHRAGAASLEEVLAGPWVLPHASSHIRTLVDATVFDLGAEPIVPLVECRGLLNLVRISVRTGALTIAPEPEVRHWGDALRIVDSPLRLAPPPYALLHRRYRQQLPQVLALRRCALAAARQLVAGAQPEARAT